MAGGEKFRYDLRSRLESGSRRGTKLVSMIYACRDHGDLEVCQAEMESPIGDRYATFRRPDQRRICRSAYPCDRPKSVSPTAT